MLHPDDVPIPRRTAESALACVEGFVQAGTSESNVRVTHCLTNHCGDHEHLVPGAIGMREVFEIVAADGDPIVVCGYYWHNGECSVLVVLTVQSKPGFCETMGWPGSG